MFRKRKGYTYKKTNGSSSNPLGSTNINATYLVIVESPSKCAKIEHYLGEEYCCIASKGHLRHINGLKSIDTKNSFQPTFSIIEEKQGHLDNMRKMIANYSTENIILAMDDDREGEAIAWHICDIFDLPIETTKRIVFHEITKPAICKAVENPSIINMKLVMAQHARQVLDIIVGYKISPYLWKYLYNNKSNSLSAGRCQTPALRLVYENNMDANVEPVKSYHVQGSFFSTDMCFKLSKTFDTDDQVLDFMEKTKVHNHLLTIASVRSITKAPPLPFNTSRLLQAASNTLHYSPKDTMELCQKLYQSGYITYMRTDSSQYAKLFLDHASAYIKSEWGEQYVGDLTKIVSKDETNPHEAIRATQIAIRTIQSIDDSRLETMYKFIWRNTVESIMPTATFNASDINITAANNLLFQHTIEIPTFLGWKIVQNKANTITDDQSNPAAQLMHIKMVEANRKPISYNNISADIHMKKSHCYYTEASLIKKLEDMGIGRPSTFASIVDTIQTRGYVNRMDIVGKTAHCNSYQMEKNEITIDQVERVFGAEKQKLVLQPVGTLACEFLLKYFNDLFEYEYTKKMESELDDISNGTCINWEQICKKCVAQIKSYTSYLTGLSKQTFPLENGYVYIFEKYGPAIKHTLDDGSVEYIPAKKNMNIDLDKLKNKEYTLDDLIEISTISLGLYESHEVILKNGRYGLYVEYNNKRESLKSIDKQIDLITLDDVRPILSSILNPINEQKQDLRTLNEYMSVRHGKYGAYVYYKRPEMKKPQFLNVKKCPHGYLNCEVSVLVEWLCNTYNIKL